MSQIDLFHVTENTIPDKPPRRQTINPPPDATQIEAFDFDDSPDVQSAHYMRFWDMNGLRIQNIADNWYPYRQGDTTARQKSLTKVRRRFDQLTSTGLVGLADIVTTESNMPEYLYEPEPRIQVKRYPQSTQKI